jgi:nitrogen PTS system EIIA component
MDLSIEAAARILGLSEDRVHGLARQGVLPAYHLDGEYRFNKIELQEWATAHQHRLAPDIFSDGEAGQAPLSLQTALRRGGIHHRLAGTTREEVLRAVSELPSLPATVNRSLLFELLLHREALASTGVGNGIALPHPRDPLVAQVEGPTLVLCLLEAGVDFGAVDGQPVHVLFTLLAPTVRAHLQLLARLSYALGDEQFRRLVREAAPAERILARAQALDAATPPRKDEP